jgi:hypothetical protein
MFVPNNGWLSTDYRTFISTAVRTSNPAMFSWNSGEETDPWKPFTNTLISASLVRKQTIPTERPPHVGECCLVVGVPGYRSRGLGFDSRRYQILWEITGLKRGPLSLVWIIKEIFEWKSSGSRSRKSRLTAVGIRFADHATSSIRKSCQPSLIQSQNVTACTLISQHEREIYHFRDFQVNVEKIYVSKFNAW